MKIRLFTIGRMKARGFRLAQADYLQRLQHYIHIDLLELKDVPTRNRTEAQIQDDETRTVLRVLPNDAFLVVLDRRGKLLSSEDLASFLNKLMGDRRKTVVFAIGGPHGFSEALRQRADLVLSLSAMTFPHELARVMLLEQLYRAFTILKGEKYHK
ncbi:MAG: 23S rRNA (pseudouridine(1915)-N(3))-methyltransferase RlmH [candidate division KSB1 bacterium]|nr:23S rRNA (pseudouridine(1915)-N(3))-methyltransferase RlmH [candidate division KSB1 bacterium]